MKRRPARGADRTVPVRSSAGGLERTAVRLPGLVLILAQPTARVQLIHDRVSWLLAEPAVPPSGIVVLSATEATARQIRNALARNAEGVMVDTVPTFGHRLLREQSRLIGYSRGFGVIDAKAARSLLREVLTELAQPASPAAIVHTLQAISKLKQAAGDSVSSAWAGPQLAEIRTRYDLALRSRRLVDPDDLVAHAVTVLRQHPQVLAHIHDRFRHVLVDGYSRLTRAETELISLLVRGHDQLFAIDSQAAENWVPPAFPFSNVLDLRAVPEPNPQAEVAPRRAGDASDGRVRQGRPVLAVKEDLEAYLRVILDPHDDAAFVRAIELLGVSPAARQGMLQLAGSLKLSLYAGVPRAAMLSRMPARSRAALRRFRSLIQRWQGVAETGGERAVLSCVLEDTGYLATLRRRGDAAPLETVARLLRVARNGHSAGGAATIEALLRRLRD